jgi:hypothetical protein
MLDFMEIVSDVVKVVTFQANHRPGHRSPARERRPSHETHEWDDQRRDRRR